MTYSDFTLKQVAKTFGLTVRRAALFDQVTAVTVPAWLSDWLTRVMPFAFGSEKARSEFLVAPMLIASIDHKQPAFSISSGQRFDVDAAQGLVGECDFVITRTPPLPFLQAPVVTLVEAKRHDIDAGWGQCAAQMVAARLFNEREGTPMQRVFGGVTTGEIWQFLKLEADILTIDSTRYYLDNTALLIGALDAITEATK